MQNVHKFVSCCSVLTAKWKNTGRAVSDDLWRRITCIITFVVKPNTPGDRTESLRSGEENPCTCRKIGHRSSRATSVPWFLGYIYLRFRDRGSTVVKVLCYKSVGRWFDPSWCQCIFHWSFRSHHGPGVDSTSNRNEYQEYFLGVKAVGA